MSNYKNIIPGLLLTISIAVLSKYLEFSVGSVATAIFIGFVLNNLFHDKLKACTPGIDFSEKSILSFAIVLLGSTVNFTFLNYKIFLIITFIISISIIISLIIGRLFRVERNLSILIGIGNAVCGSSAIAGASKVINAKKEDIGISIGVINFLGAMSIPLIPILLLNIFPYFSDEQNSFVIGSTVQALGQVVATGNVISNSVGEHATIIKMIRISMLGPLIIVLNLIVANKTKAKSSIILPKFIIGFILVALLTHFSLIPHSLVEIFQKISKILLIIAMAGVGLKISLNDILKFGKKSFFVGTLGFIIQLLVVCALTFLYF